MAKKGERVTFSPEHRENIAASKRGSKSHFYRGEDIGYGGVHTRLGDIKSPCVKCGGPGKDWALKKDVPPARLYADWGSGRIRIFSRTTSDYEVLCRKCHIYVDDTICARHGRKTHCKYGHEYTPENTRISIKGERACRACHRVWDRAKYLRKRSITHG